MGNVAPRHLQPKCSSSRHWHCATPYLLGGRLPCIAHLHANAAMPLMNKRVYDTEQKMAALRDGQVRASCHGRLGLPSTPLRAADPILLLRTAGFFQVLPCAPPTQSCCSAPLYVRWGP